MNCRNLSNDSKTQPGSAGRSLVLGHAFSKRIGRHVLARGQRIVVDCNDGVVAYRCDRNSDNRVD